MGGCSPSQSSLGVHGSGGQKSVVLGSKFHKIVVLANEKQLRQVIENTFMECLVNKGYEVASRGDIPVVYKEIVFQQSGNTAGEAANFGKILKCDAVLLVDVTELDGTKSSSSIHITKLTLSARLVDVETSSIIWMNTKSYNPSLFETLIKIPFTVFVGSDEVKQVAGSIMKDFPGS